VIIFPGMGGTSDKTYIKHLIRTLSKKDITCGVLHIRGSGFTELTTPEFPDMTRTSDWQQGMEHIYKKYPTQNLYGIGVSMGANMMLKYCGQNPEHAKFRALVSINNPWCI
jgi:predicted alpha/beta-fold hydrolase